MSARPAPRWDVYCRVVDHFGDAGVLWRLARRLAAGGDRSVRLWIDRIATLARLVPEARLGTSIDGVRIGDWAQAAASSLPDVVVTGFDCAPEPAVRHRMRPGSPLWITVEHLSAESWVERFHGSPSPKTDGCIEHFFYPGFTAGTGGLLLEPGVLAARDACLAATPGEPVRLFVFCYPGSALAVLAAACRQESSQSGRKWEIVRPAAGIDAPRSRRLAPGVRLTRTPFVPQRAFDAALRASDIDFVRGEDSWVRALWAARPSVWQAWRQDRDTRAAKVEAFLARQAGWLDAADAAALERLSRWWNDLEPTPPVADLASALAAVVDSGDRIRQRLRAWGDELSQRELATSLVRFAGERAGRPL